jgi:hypothetical protein
MATRFKIPQYEISFLVGNEHVGAADEKVAELVTERCAKAGMAPANIATCVKYGLLVHKENRQLYEAIMRPRTKGKKRTETNAR